MSGSGKVEPIWKGVEIYDAEHQKHKAEDVLKDKVVALYFGAGWCMPCKLFTRKLKRFYEALKKANKNFEIIFVSRDKEDEDLKEYFAEHHGKWYFLGFGDPLIKEWHKRYEVKHIPAIKIIKSDGSIVADDPRKDIIEKGVDNPVELFNKWAAAASL